MFHLKQAFDRILHEHYVCPRGVMGRIAGQVMLRQHIPETSWTIHLLDIQPTDTVLEIGFGAGQGIKLAAEKATHGQIKGLDLSAEMVSEAKKRNAQAVKTGRVALSQGTITSLPFDDRYFDKIMTIHTIYFWLESDEPARALDEMCRVLRPGGKLAITLSTGEINAQGGVEVWGSLQSALEENVIPAIQRNDFRAVRLERGPNSRDFVSVAVIGEK